MCLLDFLDLFWDFEGTAQVLRLRHFEKYFFLVLCGFNRWLESDIMCVFMCSLICPSFYMLFTIFVVIICGLEALNLD